MKYVSQYIHEYESVEIGYYFSIPLTHSVLSEDEFQTLARKLDSFHKEYIHISRKYKICEVVYDSVLKDEITTADEAFVVFSKENNLDYLCFFPFSQAGKREYQKAFHTEIYSTTSDLSFDNYNIVYLFAGGFLNLKEAYSMPIDFSIEVRSNIFYPFLEGNDWKNKDIDNRANAYLNTPRLNSFLRALKALFKERGWSFEFDYAPRTLEIIEFRTEDGILIDGKIIYQEDIENGLIQLTDIFL